MLYLLQRTLQYIEHQNDWISCLQSIITEKEQNYKIIHSMITREILRELGSSVVDSRVEDVVPDVKEEFPDTTDGMPIEEIQNNQEEDVDFSSYTLSCTEDYQTNDEDTENNCPSTNSNFVKYDQLEEGCIKEERNDENEMNYEFLTSSDCSREEERENSDHCDVIHDTQPPVNGLNETLDDTISYVENFDKMDLQDPSKKSNFDPVIRKEERADIQENVRQEDEVAMNYYESSNGFVPKEILTKSQNEDSVDLRDKTSTAAKQEQKYNFEPLNLQHGNNLNMSVTRERKDIETEQSVSEEDKMKKKLSSNHTPNDTHEDELNNTLDRQKNCDEKLNNDTSIDKHEEMEVDETTSIPVPEVRVLHENPNYFNMNKIDLKSLSENDDKIQHKTSNVSGGEPNSFDTVNDVVKCKVAVVKLQRIDVKELRKIAAFETPNAAEQLEHAKTCTVDNSEKLRNSGAVSHDINVGGITLEMCHEINERDGNSPQCDICLKSQRIGKKFKHIHTSTAKYLFKCTHCDDLFRTFYDYQMHLHTHYTIKETCKKEKPYKCTICDKLFANAHNLVAHKSMHTKELNKCKYCYKSFDTDGHLRIHLAYTHW